MSNSEQETKRPQIYEFEGDPYAPIEFVVVREDGIHKIYQMECNLCCRNSGLKHDFAQLFGIPEERQSWTLNDILLNDDDILLKYIPPVSDNEFTIIVTCR